MKPDRHRLQIERALRNGRCEMKKTNTCVEFEGKTRELVTFRGVRLYAEGMLTFWHWNSKVMQVDLSRDMATDFGYQGYSFTTNRNLWDWGHAIRGLRLSNVSCFDLRARAFDWTWTGRLNLDRRPIRPWYGPQFVRDAWIRFQKRAPWIVWIDHYPWISGARFDYGDYQDFMVTMNSLEGSNNHGANRHWFTADWDANGRWARRFIDDNARDRYVRNQIRKAA